MTSHPTRSAACLLLLLLAGASPALAKEKTVKLKFRTADEKERLSVPFERRWILAEKGADLPIGPRKRLQCKVMDEERIKVDVKGTGDFTAVVKRGEILELKFKDPEGGTQRHAIRMVNDVYARPCLEPACARVGKLKGTRIAIVDADLNGRYTDYGRDLMVVGKLPYAFPLSHLVVVGRSLLRIVVAEDGSSLQATELEEPLVKLDFGSKLKGLKKPKLVVFRRAGETAPDHVAAFRSPALVPAGDWTLAYAMFEEDLWAVGKGALVPIEVRAEPVKWAWGAPFSLVGKAAVRGHGYQRTVKPPGVLKAPEMHETKVPGTHVVFDFPPDVVGSAGVTFVGSWQHAGEGGVSLADKRISHFDVYITKDNKRLNVDMPKWAPYDMSGLVKKKRPFWTTFEWPAGSVRGTVSIFFRCKSPLFGGELRSEPFDLEVK